MKRVILTGASGMIGGIVLQHCLNSTEIGEVISIVRKPTGKRHVKLDEIIHTDFTDYSSLRNTFKNIDIAYFCLGVYTGSVADNEFRKITVDYTVSFADVLKEQSPGATLCFLSGQGADRKVKSRMAFARYKGIAENYLISKQFAGLYIFRPSYIYPVEKRKEPNIGYSIYRTLYPVLALFGSNWSIKSTQLGEAMFKCGLTEANKQTLENADILELVFSL